MSIKTALPDLTHRLPLVVNDDLDLDSVIARLPSEVAIRLRDPMTGAEAVLVDPVAWRDAVALASGSAPVRKAPPVRDPDVMSRALEEWDGAGPDGLDP